MIKEFFYGHDDLSPDLHSFEQIICITRLTDVSNTGLFYDLIWIRIHETAKKLIKVRYLHLKRE